MPFIVATYVYASSQGQRTHSARTKTSFHFKPMYRAHLACRVWLQMQPWPRLDLQSYSSFYSVWLSVRICVRPNKLFFLKKTIFLVWICALACARAQIKRRMEPCEELSVDRNRSYFFQALQLLKKMINFCKNKWSNESLLVLAHTSFITLNFL